MSSPAIGREVSATPYTRGPWKIVPIMRGKYRGDIGIAPPHELDPVFCFLAKGRDDIQAANARLIAAAPELLEALLALTAVTWSTDKHEINKAHGQALAAIAKAEGRS